MFRNPLATLVLARLVVKGTFDDDGVWVIQTTGAFREFLRTKARKDQAPILRSILWRHVIEEEARGLRRGATTVRVPSDDPLRLYTTIPPELEPVQ